MSLLARRRGVGAKVTTSFNPLTQVTALHAMWAGDTLWSNPGDGNPITSVRNQSGGGDPTNGGGTQRPTYRASVSQLGNRPGWEFDGSDDRLTFNITDAAQSVKAIGVFRYITATTNTVVFGAGGGTGQAYLISGTSKWQLSYGTVLNSAGNADTTGHVVRWTGDGASSQQWLDGTSLASGNAGTTAHQWIKLGHGGATATHSNYANCVIAFFALYDGATTSDGDLATLAADLKTHYGL